MCKLIKNADSDFDTIQVCAKLFQGLFQLNVFVII